MKRGMDRPPEEPSMPLSDRHSSSQLPVAVVCGIETHDNYRISTAACILDGFVSSMWPVAWSCST